MNSPDTILTFRNLSTFNIYPFYDRMYVSTVIFLTRANSLHHVEILQFEIHDFMLLTIFSKTINNKNQLNGSVEKLIVFVKIMYYRLVVIVWFLARCRG